MRRILITLILLETAVQGQSLDLAGDWRRSIDDRPDYARMEFDDRAWETVRLPWIEAPPLGVYWLRRSVELPREIDSSQAVITLGPVAEVYEVFLNGVRIAQAGVFQDRFAAQIAQSRTFAIPPAALAAGAGRLQLALRVERVFSRGYASSFGHFSGGAYVITDAVNAPRQENELLFAQRKLFRAYNFAVGAVLLASGLLFLLLWLYQRAERQLLWLALLAASRGAFEVLAFVMFEPGQSPLWPNWPIVAHAANGAALAQLILWTIGLRSWGWSAGCSLPWTVYAAIYPFGWAGATSGYLDLLALAVLGFGWWHRTRGAAGWAEWLMVGLLALAVIAHGDATFRLWTSLRQGIANAMATLSGLMMFLTLRRLNQDRREKERLAAELEAARLVQQLFLSAPAGASAVAAVDAIYEPAHEVGGDFHWTRGEPDGSLLVVVGDVSGKGLKAAMLVSLVVGFLRNEKSSQPGTILAAVNNGLAGHTSGGFVTCCCARFDADGTVTLASAGHPAPYADGRELEVATGLPLGIVTGVAYEESTTTGTYFTFVSDGVIEAENAQRELFGFDRTREISTKSPREIAEAAKGWGQNDDITVVTVRRNA